MSSNLRRAAFIRAFVVTILFASLAGAQSAGSVAVQIIDGSPLNIHVGADGAFQIFNDQVPGVGQIFPSNCQRIADMGVFANVDGVLFAPNFAAHGCGTATGGLGTYTAWSTAEFTPLRGTGSPQDPFNIRITLAGGILRVNVDVKYVNGDNFFRVTKSVTSAVPANTKIFFGADIYLAGSDNGVAYLEGALRSPGGQDCATPPTYSILFIPITPANAYTAAQFATVWSQIGGGQLNREIATAGCIDNGAALQWDRTIVPGQTATINSAVSFGSIPDASNFVAFSMTPDPAVSVIQNGATQQFLINVRRNNLEFNAPITLQLDPLPAGLTASLDRSTIAAPGDGTVVLTVTAIDLRPEIRTISFTGTGGGETAYGSITLDVVCDPPFILGLPENQPQTQSVTRGQTATLRVSPGGSGPLAYQWYEGPVGSTYFPIEGATSASFTTRAIQQPTAYWVRVSNACGAVDSNGATIFPR